MLVKEIMTKKVITLKPEETLKEIAVKFAKNNISGAPVVDDEGKVIGIVSETDIFTTLKRNFSELKLVHLDPALSMVGLSFKETPTDKKTEEIFQDIGGIMASVIMKHNVKTVGPEDDIKVVVDIVSTGKINRVPVVDDGKLVGIVTRGDIIKGMSSLVC